MRHINNLPRINYRGDTRRGAPVGTQLGPTMFGEPVWVAGAEYDPGRDRTVVTVAFRKPAVSPGTR